ncbi:MAG: phytanoyl-CoA dioxygenase family protein [Dokdonia sp.]|jgi:hypothetical protein|nr:hypothetical protein [Cytophagaceae bacterium]
MEVKVLSSYLNWKPIKHRIFKSEKLAHTIHTKGYQVVDFLTQDVLDELDKIYTEEHHFDLENGGMFYSMYSKDTAYRKRVHSRIGELLKPKLEEYFKAYNNVINAFVVKLPGEKSEFYVHQDTTGLDELKYSPLSLWIPLQDITKENGALSVIEKTQWFFSPYRGISFPFPFKGINETIKRYLKPVFMKRGQALFFDNRIIHNSMANTSSKARVAIICGLFPKEASFMTCYKDPEQTNSPIELYQHDANFLLEYPQFFYNCTDRPTSGKVVATVDEVFPQMNTATFETLCATNDITPVDYLENIEATTTNCDLIAEPDGVNKFEPATVMASDQKSSSFWSFLKIKR